MAQLKALLSLWCPGPEDYDPSPETLEAQRRDREERLEREKHTIFNVSQFKELARIEGESGALGVKLLRDKQGVLFWMDTKAWPFHYPFCVSFLGETRPLPEFNAQVYTGKDRSMMFATVVGYPVADQLCMCLELNPADPMNNLKALNGFFEDVKKSFLEAPGTELPLHFHPTSAVQMEAIKNQTLALPVMTSNQLFGSIKYKLVVPGEIKTKRTRVYDKRNYTEEEFNKWVSERSPDEVIIIPKVPNDIPAVAGVICGEIIPPLCHVALLCQNRKTPCCFVQDCINLLWRGDFENHNPIIRGTVARSGFFITGTYSKGNITTVDSPTLVDVPKPNTSVTQLIDLHEDKAHATDGHVVGAKAAQLAKVEAMYSQPLFKGTFTIPFHYYEKRVYNNNAVSNLITSVAKTAAKKYDSVQAKINELAVDAELVKHVIEKIKQNNMTSVIFRSSTNAEDLTGFNGAGLYESVPLKGDHALDPKQVGEAIKKVWASVWSSKAVKEREYYKMTHRNVNMAILVQPYIDVHSSGLKVHYNGVCITHDVAHHGLKHGFVVNCFPGTELRATNHYKNNNPEQTVLALGREPNSVDVHIVSTATGRTEPLVTQHDAEKMVQVFGKLHSTMLNKPHKLDDTVALDIEFMVVDNAHSKDTREIVVLQARPYTVNVVNTDALDEQVKQYALSNSMYQRKYPASSVHYCTMYN